jgi:hypothetical protein
MVFKFVDGIVMYGSQMMLVVLPGDQFLIQLIDETKIQLLDSV